MTSTEAVKVAIGAHLVGGIKAPDTETAMTTAAEILGDYLHAIPDGETGARAAWIGYQIQMLTGIDGIDLAGTKRMPSPENDSYQEIPALSVDASLTEIPARALGYADHAEESYAVFKKLRANGTIPQGVKFEVTIPTAYASVVAWVRPEDQERFFPIYAKAIDAELTEIANAIPHEDLLVQYDVAIEFASLTGAYTAAGNIADKDFVLQSVRDSLSHLPRDIEQGLHLCYGDFGHKHFTVPTDLSLCVEVANACEGLSDFVHMPADRNEGRNSSYYTALKDLKIDNLSLGVIDYEGDRERTEELIAAAVEGSGGKPFSISAECGLARIDHRDGDGPTLEQLLQMHADLAQPIR